MKKMLAFALIALLALPTLAFAQTMKVSGDLGGGLVQFMDVAGAFDVVITMDTDGNPSSAAEFVVTEMLVAAPGTMFKTNTAKINNTTLDLGDNSVGEYLLSFEGCVNYAGPELELVRVSYFVFAGPVPETVVSLRGFLPGDSRPSSFGGEVGFIDCSNTKIPATVGGTDGGYTGSGAIFPDGGMVINPFDGVVPNEEGSFGQLKARF